MSGDGRPLLHFGDTWRRWIEGGGLDLKTLVIGYMIDSEWGYGWWDHLNVVGVGWVGEFIGRSYRVDMGGLAMMRVG